MSGPYAKRFWAKVDKSGDCWIWTASKRKGYGQFRIDGKSQSAHRVSWELTYGEIPNIDGSDYRGTCVCHKCDNRACVRPDHLFIASQADNLSDMAKKGRAAYSVGSANHNAKLCDVDVWLIRNVNSTQKNIAEWFGVSQSLVSLIRSGKIWSHVGERP